MEWDRSLVLLVSPSETEAIFTKRNIFLTKITAVQKDVALSYNRIRGLYFLAVIFAATILLKTREKRYYGK